MIGLPRPHDFLEAHHQDQVFRLLGLQVMCPVLWMYPPRGKSVTMTSWVSISQAFRQNCEVVVLYLTA